MCLVFTSSWTLLILNFLSTSICGCKHFHTASPGPQLALQNIVAGSITRKQQYFFSFAATVYLTNRFFRRRQQTLPRVKNYLGTSNIHSGMPKWTKTAENRIRLPTKTSSSSHCCIKSVSAYFVCSLSTTYLSISICRSKSRGCIHS